MKQLCKNNLGGGQKSCQNNLGRESNIELLRLVCMLFIILLHSMNFGLDITGVDSNSKFLPIGAVEAFFILAVDCFVLISGYFGIKAKWKGFIHLYIMCAFYSVLLTLFSFYEAGQFSIKEFLFSFLVFSNSKWWFIQCYVYLFILSPMLNWTVKSINNKASFIILLLVWSILTFYFGFFWAGNINPNGYNVMNFIFLYFIGRFVALHISSKNDIKTSCKYIGGYILSSLLVSTMYLTVYYLNLDEKWVWLKCYSYNNPFVILAAVSLFLAFRSFSFQSKSINWLASSALAIYLLHSNAVVSDHLWSFIAYLQEIITNGWLLSLSLVFLALAIMMACILIDKLRMIVTNPIERLILKINWDGYTNKLVKKLLNLI